MPDPFAAKKKRRSNVRAKYPALREKINALERVERGLPLKVPEDIFCPYTGEKLEIRTTKTSFPGVVAYMAVGSLYMTRSYPTERQLKWVLCHRNGEAPPFPVNAVEVKHREPPMPSTVADQLRADEAVEQKALDTAERIIEGAADRKIFVQPGGLKS